VVLASDLADLEEDIRTLRIEVVLSFEFFLHPVLHYLLDVFGQDQFFIIIRCGEVYSTCLV
jgi:hypothetical protein